MIQPNTVHWRRALSVLACLALVGVIVMAGCGRDEDGDLTGAITMPEDEKAGGGGLPSVTDLDVADHEYLPAVVELVWSAPVEYDPDYDVWRYEVAVSSSGPITSRNWNSATIIDVIAHTGPSYFAQYDDSDPGITAGASLHFAVRPFYADPADTNHQPLNQPAPMSVPHVVSDEAFVSGSVIDNYGQPIQGVDVVSIPGLIRATTNASGAYQLGPISDTAAIVLQTESSDVLSAPGANDAWFDYRTSEFVVGDSSARDLHLLRRYGDIDYELGSAGYDDFSSYYRDAMGLNDTDVVTTYHWPSYPIKVYVVDEIVTVTNPDGSPAVTDFGAQVRSSFATWSFAMGDPSLITEVADSTQADVIAQLAQLGGSQTGLNAYEPTDAFRVAPPEFVRVMINRGFEPLFYTENESKLYKLIMHEFGHALGHADHPEGFCVDENGERLDVLMRQGNVGGFYAPHAFDKRVLHTVRNLPQGHVISGYERYGVADTDDFPPLVD